MKREEIWVANEKLKSSNREVGLELRLDSGSAGPGTCGLGALNDVYALTASLDSSPLRQVS